MQKNIWGKSYDTPLVGDTSGGEDRSGTTAPEKK
jgi:hypothetical protein